MPMIYGMLKDSSSSSEFGRPSQPSLPPEYDDARESNTGEIIDTEKAATVGCGRFGHPSWTAYAVNQMMDGSKWGGRIEEIIGIYKDSETPTRTDEWVTIRKAKLQVLGAELYEISIIDPGFGRMGVMDFANLWVSSQAMKHFADYCKSEIEPDCRTMDIEGWEPPSETALRLRGFIQFEAKDPIEDLALYEAGVNWDRWSVENLARRHG